MKEIKIEGTDIPEKRKKKNPNIKGLGTKQAKQGGQKLKDQRGKKMMGRKKKTKRKVFMRCHMNSLALVNFTWLHWMVTKMDSVAKKFDYHYWMANKMGSIVTIKFSRCHQIQLLPSDGN